MRLTTLAKRSIHEELSAGVPLPLIRRGTLALLHELMLQGSNDLNLIDYLSVKVDMASQMEAQHASHS